MTSWVECFAKKITKADFSSGNWQHFLKIFMLASSLFINVHKIEFRTEELARVLYSKFLSYRKISMNFNTNYVLWTYNLYLYFTVFDIAINICLANCSSGKR